MATLTINEVVRGAGLLQALVSPAAGGDEFVNTGREYLHVKMGGATDVTVTIAAERTVHDLAVADYTVVCATGEDRFIGPFPVDTFNDGDEKVQITYSHTTGYTVGIFKLST